MCEVTSLKVNGGIDGTIRCSCGWYRYLTFPGRGWGRKSVGIKLGKGMTKPKWINNKLVVKWAEHASKVAA